MASWYFVFGGLRLKFRVLAVCLRQAGWTVMDGCSGCGCEIGLGGQGDVSVWRLNFRIVLILRPLVHLEFLTI